MQELKQPTKTVPYPHYVCLCGKPVKPESAWYIGYAQVHFKCKGKY